MITLPSTKQKVYTLEFEKCALLAIDRLGFIRPDENRGKFKNELISILGFDERCFEDVDLFGDCLADWLVIHSDEFRNGDQIFGKNEDLVKLSLETQQTLKNLMERFESYLSDGTRDKDYFEAADEMYLRSQAYLNYSNALNMIYSNPYMLPSNPSIIPSSPIMPPNPPIGYPDKQSFENAHKNYGQPYYMQMPKYGYQMNPLFMPPPPAMQMQMPKYGISSAQDFMKAPHYPYQLPSHGHPSVSPINHKHDQYLLQPPTQLVQPVSSSKSTKNSGRNENSSLRMGDENEAQLLKSLPFQIIPPRLQKGNREEIPEYLPRMTIDNMESSEIMIVNKNDHQKGVRLGTQKVKTLSNQLGAKIGKSENQSNTGPLIGKEYRENFKLCVCKGYGVDKEVFQCSECKESFHYNCTLKKQKDQSNEKTDEDSKKQTCHFCFMKEMDPLNEVETSIALRYLSDIRVHKFHEFINFEIYDNPVMDKNLPYEIELRCMRLEDSSNSISEYTWPDECLIMLNEEKTFEFQALQHNSSLKKRKDMPILLTNYIFNYPKNFSNRKNLSIGLEIKDYSFLEAVQKKIKNNYIFILGIFLIKKKTPDELCEEITKNENNKVNFAEKFFNMSAEEEDVEVEQVKVNLMDPFSWNLIDIPVRGQKCVHGQCFDLKTFLSLMNTQRIRQWKCPVCCKECRSFSVDIQQIEAIKEYKNQETLKNKKISKEVSFHRDGRILFVQQNDDDDDDDDDEEENNRKEDNRKTKQIAKEEKESL